MASYIATTEELTAVADAIRAKGGTSEQLVFPDGFISAISEIQGGEENWYPSDTVLLFKHFNNGLPDINTVGFSEEYPITLEDFGGSINPYSIGKGITLDSIASAHEEGTAFFDYAIIGYTSTYQRLISTLWKLNDKYNQRFNIYCKPNSITMYSESVSDTHGDPIKFGTVLVSYSKTTVDAYFGAYATGIEHVSLVKSEESVVSEFYVGCGSDAYYKFNGNIWNVGFVPRNISYTEIQRILGK